MRGGTGRIAMDISALIVMFRGSERLIIVIAAGFSIWLGYRLFQALPTIHGSDGSLQLPSARVTLSKVGPGVFFVLFGVAVLWQAVRTTVTIPLEAPDLPSPPRTAGAETSRASAIMGVGAGDPMALPHTARDIKVLNCVAGAANSGLDPQEIETAVFKAKVAMVRRVWQQEWTDADRQSLDNGVAPPAGPLAQIFAARDANCKL
jgi:hypothetical protein